MMTYPAARFALAGVLLAAVASASAQEASPAAPPAPSAASASSPLTAPKPEATTVTGTTAPSISAPAAAKKPRPMSDEVAAIMATGRPKYNPPKVEEKAPEPVAEEPKNDIPRLPQFVVRGNRTPVFKERDLHTTKGLSDIEMKRHPGLDIPYIGFLNRPIALEMYRDEQRLSDIDDIRKAAADAAMAGDTAGSDYIRRTGAETFVRRSSGGMLENAAP